jgi:hypothetical protein
MKKIILTAALVFVAGAGVSFAQQTSFEAQEMKPLFDYFNNKLVEKRENRAKVAEEKAVREAVIRAKIDTEIKAAYPKVSTADSSKENVSDIIKLAESKNAEITINKYLLKNAEGNTVLRVYTMQDDKKTYTAVYSLTDGKRVFFCEFDAVKDYDNFLDEKATKTIERVHRTK